MNKEKYNLQILSLIEKQEKLKINSIYLDNLEIPQEKEYCKIIFGHSYGRYFVKQIHNSLIKLYDEKIVDCYFKWEWINDDGTDAFVWQPGYFDKYRAAESCNTHLDNMISCFKCYII
jgi:hypothetical protein